MDPDACPAGTTKDLCDCCTVCAGTLGETCGGPWGIYGDCGVGFECHQDPCSQDADDSECYLYYLTEPGQCVEKRRRSILDLFSHAGKTGIDEVRQRRRLRLLHELETLKK
ncbi:single insulin-like growth factor-binding domain protein-1 isoform X2 [Panulirus ornatus]